VLCLYILRVRRFLHSIACNECYSSSYFCIYKLYCLFEF